MHRTFLLLVTRCFPPMPISLLPTTPDVRLRIFKNHRLLCNTDIIALRFYALTTGSLYLSVWRDLGSELELISKQ